MCIPYWSLYFFDIWQLIDLLSILRLAGDHRLMFIVKVRSHYNMDFFVQSCRHKLHQPNSQLTSAMQTKRNMNNAKEKKKENSQTKTTISPLSFLFNRNARHRSFSSSYFRSLFE